MNKYFGAVSLTDLTRTLVQSVAPTIQTSGRHETFNSTGTAYCFVAIENYPSKLSNNLVNYLVNKGWDTLNSHF